MIRYAQDSVVERLEHRLSKLAGMPLENLERMNMVRYAPGEHFDEHHDGKFRPVTIFVYLNELPEDDTAGETFFPVLGVSFKPRRGTAVMWSNVVGDMEDSRMLHAGLAPSKAVKYGVNCFFNVNEMRHLAQFTPDAPFEDLTTVHVSELSSKSSQVVAYRLCPNPKLIAVPGFLQTAECFALLELAACAGKTEREPQGGQMLASRDPFANATRTLRLLKTAETPLIKEIEERLAGVAGLGLDYLGPLRLVAASPQLGLNNRGCGPKTAHVCLSKSRSQVIFPKLGVRLILEEGDLIMWPNVNWDTETAVEDIRTVCTHPAIQTAHSRNQAELPTLGIDAFFHDNPIREQQSRRHFVTEEEAAEIVNSLGTEQELAAPGA
jgi:hypothetical protein